MQSTIHPVRMWCGVLYALRILFKHIFNLNVINIAKCGSDFGCLTFDTWAVY